MAEKFELPLPILEMSWNLTKPWRWEKGSISCHSGGFSLENVPTADIDKTVEHFTGRGFTVLASYGDNQSSGFDEDNEISLYE